MIAVRQLESYGTTLVPYEPHRVQERLQNLQLRGFHVVTDSAHEAWEDFPHIPLQERTYSRFLNRDYALDLLSEYQENGNLQLPPDLHSVIPSAMDYRRTTQDPFSPYEFRMYRPELHVLLLTTLALLHPPTISENWIDSYFSASPTNVVDLKAPHMKTFEVITTKLDEKRSKDLEKIHWPENE